MPTSAGVDVGTRGIRIAFGDPYRPKVMEISKDEVEYTFRLLKGYGVGRLCLAGGYQWKEMRGEDVYSNMDSVLPYTPPKETVGFRRTLTHALNYFKEVLLLPSGGSSGEVPEQWLLNALDTGTPDKIAKANYVYWTKGLSTFTLIDLGCFVSVLYVVDGAIVRFFSATRGMPGKCSPGIVDLELLLIYDWPKSNKSIIKSGVEKRVTEEWLRFLRPTFVGDEVVCPSDVCDKFSAAKGALLWCEGFKLKHAFSDAFERYVTLRD